MSMRKTLCAVALSLMAASNCQMASAAPVVLKRSPQTELTVNQPVDRLGKLLLPQGQLKVRGLNVEVQAVPEWLFDRHTVLKGRLLTVQMNNGSEATSSETAAPAGTSMELLVYFNDGDWLRELYKGRRSRDNVTLKAGTAMSGHIRTVADGFVNIETLPGKVERVPVEQIVSVNSPFAYRVTVGLTGVKIAPDTSDITADGGAVVFAPASLASGAASIKWSQNKTATLPPSNLPGTEGGITKTKIAGMIAVDAANTLAPLIAIPIVVPLGERSAIRQLNAYQQADILNYIMQTPTLPSSISRF